MAAAAPLVWLLIGDKAGDNAQLRALAGVLGWPAVERRFRCNALFLLPNHLLGATLATLNRGRSDALAPPWPDLVLASGRRAVPLARWIRAQSGGRTRLVHVGRPWAPPGWFDLVLTTPLYGLSPRANVMIAALPFNRLDPERLRAAATAAAPDVAGLPRPLLTVAIGGPSAPLVFPPDLARRIGAIARGWYAKRGGAVLVSTSRRTPPAVGEGLAAALAGVPHRLYRFRPDDPANPHLGWLGLADAVLVTGDSASMLAEACRLGVPVSVVDLPRRGDPAAQAVGLLRGLVPGPVRQTLVDGGWALAERRMDRLIAPLAAAGAIGRNGVWPLQPPHLPDDLAAAAARIRALFA